ncbi:SppA protein [Vibrio parahaemolyticus]|uniref:SDH family Clp fold serine proteinase n=1 Tax=Vibrio parahaemolyticus TaxID=670 RepID=UPI00111F38C4|nr:SppA protein [Vibrio parahaemolyticus]TOP08535.1 SppA protein [Vibrio parahaemolyticus]HCG9118641.1 hypothetical protein [Vibrio parahaemolyticus]
MSGEKHDVDPNKSQTLEQQQESKVKSLEAPQAQTLAKDLDCATYKEDAQSKTDVISYVGPISRDGYTKLTQIIEQKIINGEKGNNLILVLTTPGGNPDYGYRIGRAINHYYDDTSILIPDICKSAGTLVALAAKRLIVGDLGELGPLDIQFRKPDEMGEQTSTLNIFKTVSELQVATLDSFRHFVTDIRYGSGIGTKLSAEIAANLTKALISPISAQVDPIKLGEHNRALQIAKDYANRLNQVANNLVSTEALDKLVSGYPCHSFVIDRKEAKTLFRCVDKPTTEEESLIYLFSRHYLSKGILERSLYASEAEVIDFHQIMAESFKDQAQEDTSDTSEDKVTELSQTQVEETEGITVSKSANDE